MNPADGLLGVVIAGEAVSFEQKSAFLSSFNASVIGA
jgi:hypothetical protein